ncbi:MAG: secretin N-terminal domain-containing protein [Planctomycetota bacterium]|jgi:type IV pilus assembly protein PilQ
MLETLKNFLRECALAFLMVVLVASSPAMGADQENPAAEREVGQQLPQQGLKTKITYTCVDSPIETVLMDLAEQAKMDIVKSPRVTGKVTVKVTDVPLAEALTHILAAHDYTYIATESMLRVVPLPETSVMREPLVTRIYEITYADANEVAQALRTFVSRQGKVAFSKGTSHIMVTDIESQIKGIDKFIEKIDLMTPQVLVEVRIYDISTNEGFELGPEWNLSRNTPLKTIDTSKTDIRSDSPVTSEVTTDYTETTSGYYRDSDDGPPQSFTVTGTSTEVAQLPIGSFFDSEVEQYSTRRRKPFVGGSFDRIEGGTLSFSLLNDAVDLEFALHVLHQQVEAKLLANPRVLVLDKKTANFEIFREIPYREMRQVGREDPITYTEFKDVGIHLKVTPHITRDSMLRLRVAPEFGVLVSQNLEGVPTVDTRRADTVALVRDGQTIAIGGLRKRQTSKDISKVPLLADLPLLGGLFVSETESIEINELVVFITCKIVIEPTLSDLEKKQLSRTEFASPELSELRLEREHKSRAEAEEFDIAEALDMLLQELESTGK